MTSRRQTVALAWVAAAVVVTAAASLVCAVPPAPVAAPASQGTIPRGETAPALFPELPPAAGNIHWASARQLAERLENLAGLENIGRVAAGLYRGAQPEEGGIASLKTLGIKTIVDLRQAASGAAERDACRDLGIDYVPIPLEASEPPKDEEVRAFLKIAVDPERQPVFIHCRHGKDRTGTLCAAYRMAVDGWPLEDALREMDSFGFHWIWFDLRKYVKAFPERMRDVWPTAATPLPGISTGPPR